MVSAVATGLAVVALAVLQRASGGWFWTWMTTMRHHPLLPERCVAWGAIVAAGGGALGGVFVALRRRGWLGEPTRFWGGMLAASVPACVAPMLSGGGWVNNLIGLVMLVILVMLLVACDVLRNAAAPAAVERAVLAGLAALLLGALYDPTTNVPDSARAADADALHATILGLDGDVLAPMYPFVVVRAGKPTPQMSLVAYDDTAHPGDVNADAATAIRGRTPRWVILFGHPQEDPIAWLGSRYVGRAVNLRVQALKETTGRSMTFYERDEAADGLPPRLR